VTLKRRRQTFRSSSVGLQPTDKLRGESRDPARRGSRVFKQWQCLADPGSVVPRRKRPRLFAGVSRECQRAIGCCAHNQSHCRRGAHPAQGGGLAAAGFRCLRVTLFSRAQPARGVRDELVRRGHRGRADRSALGRNPPADCRCAAALSEIAVWARWRRRASSASPARRSSVSPPGFDGGRISPTSSPVIAAASPRAAGISGPSGPVSPPSGGPCRSSRRRQRAAGSPPRSAGC